MIALSDQTTLRQVLEELRGQPGQLIEIILRQAGVMEELRQEIEKLKQEIKELNDRNDGLGAKVDALARAAARQAAPFRINDQQRVVERKRPGRPKGHPGSRRAIPDHVDEEIFVPLPGCPHCGGQVGPRRPVVQYIEELPVVRPHVTRLVTQEAACPHCQQAVRSSHPLQVSLAEGAAGVQLGPRAVGLAAELNKKHGLTMRKTCAVLQEAFNLRLTPGGLSQALARVATKLEPAYEKLLAGLREGAYVHSDETSWWVGGPGYWLWVFADKTSTVYRVAQGRGRQVLATALGDAFSGVLVSDCLAIYDDFNPLQQKCYSHHLKAIRHALDQGPSLWLEEMRWLLQKAMSLKAGGATPAHRAELEQKLSELLARPRPTNVEEKVRRRLDKQKDHLFTFLDHAAVDATNNLAERQLRPAVIARKVSCGNKTLKGARTWEILTSLAATCTQQAQSFSQLISQTVPVFHPP